MKETNVGDPIEQEDRMEKIKEALEASGGGASSQQAALEHLKRLHEAQQAKTPGVESGGAPAEERQALPIDWATEGVPAAANGVQVLHRPTEFALLFTDHAPFPGRRAVDGKVGNERAVVVSSLRMSPDAMFQAICTLASNWNRFATTVIDPRMRQPRFKLLDAGELQLDAIKKD